MTESFTVAGTAPVGPGDPEEARPVAAMLLYPGLTALDLIAPHTAWSPFMDVHLVWKTREPVVSDGGVTIQPTTTFADSPETVDILFVPGGLEQDQVVADVEVLEFLADRGSRARYVTSVCGGALILGAAGLLTGYRAATHWAARDLLPLFGAENVNDRVVVDRNRISGGGVTAGLDFGLTVLAEMRGVQTAHLSQLMMEYDPAPPFDVGSPEKAGPALTGMVADTVKGVNDRMVDLADSLAAQGWGRARGSRATPVGA